MPDGTNLQNKGVGVWRGSGWQEIEGVLPLAANQAMQPMTPIVGPSPTFDMSFYKFIFA